MTDDSQPPRRGPLDPGPPETGLPETGLPESGLPEIDASGDRLPSGPAAAGAGPAGRPGRSAGHAAELDQLIGLLAKLPGLGPRSARRAVLHLIRNRDRLMRPLGEAVTRAAEQIRVCSTCGNLDTIDPCRICADPQRDETLLCVVEQVGDLWALERTGSYRGRYHVLGGTLSALDDVGPEQLGIPRLAARARSDRVAEVILALNATVDGLTTAHYITDRLAEAGVRVTRLAHGVPVGGELDYLDDNTLTAALKSRRSG